MSHITYVILIF